MLKPLAKVRENGRVRVCFEMSPDVYALLRKIAEQDHRHLVTELTFLIQERARVLFQQPEGRGAKHIRGEIGK